MKILAKYKTSYDVSDAGQLEHVTRVRPKDSNTSATIWEVPQGRASPRLDVIAAAAAASQADVSSDRRVQTTSAARRRFKGKLLKVWATLRRQAGRANFIAANECY